MVELKIQRRLAAHIMKCAPEKVRFDTESLTDIKESITKLDVRGLIDRGIISQKVVNGSSRVRARKILVQKRKGLRKGQGSRKGTANARSDKKIEWMNKIRKLREFLKNLRDKELITKPDYRGLLKKAKGGFFRSQRHLKIYLNEHNTFIAKEEKPKQGAKK